MNKQVLLVSAIIVLVACLGFVFFARDQDQTPKCIQGGALMSGTNCIF